MDDQFKPWKTDDPVEKKKRLLALRKRNLRGQEEIYPELKVLLDPDIDRKTYDELIEKFWREGKLKLSKTAEAMIKYRGSIIVNDPALMY
mgnify:FL=1